MTDALYWLANLMVADIGRVVAGILVCVALVELLVKVREWLA